MPIMSFALALLPAAAIVQDAPDATPPEALPACKAQQQVVAPPRRPVRPESLEKQPTAMQYYAVLRTENGCQKIVMVREDVGREQR